MGKFEAGRSRNESCAIRINIGILIWDYTGLIQECAVNVSCGEIVRRKYVNFDLYCVEEKDR